MPNHEPSRAPVVTVDPSSLKPILASLREFLQPYLPMFGRSESRENATKLVHGLLSDLPRKSVEPIAFMWQMQRRVLQRFVGAGPWRDQPLRDRMVADVSDEIGTPDGVVIIDPSTMPKKGTCSVGVDRQWCGRLGKLENCQKGVYLGYASEKGHTLLDCDLYLPDYWAKTRWKRAQGSIPKEIRFRRSWEIADELLHRHSMSIPHAFVCADDEFGRCGEWRDRLNDRGERYFLDVPCNALVRVNVKGAYQLPVTAQEWAGSLPKTEWQQYSIRDTTRGPLICSVVSTSVLTTGDDCSVRKEILVVARSTDTSVDTRYYLTNAGTATTEQLARVIGRRGFIENCFQRAKGEVGMADYEVRSWPGWQHHMTLVMLSLWFLERERIRLTAAIPPSDRSYSEMGHRPTDSKSRHRSLTPRRPRQPAPHAHCAVTVLSRTASATAAKERHPRAKAMVRLA